MDCKDKGRKPFIVAGLLAYALVSVAFIFSSEVTHLIAVRFFQGMASAMIMPVIQAYVGDITPAGREGFTMGLFNMSVFFGLSLGPAAGGLLNDHFSLTAAFVCMGLLAFLGFSLCLVLLPPSYEERARRTGRAPMPWRTILGDRVVSGLVVYRLMYTAAIGMIWSFLPVLADARFHLSSSRIGVLVMLGVFASGVIQVPMGYLADRVNRSAMVVTGGLMAAAGVFAYDWASTSLGLYFASLIFGIGGGTAMPALMAVAVDKGSETQSMGSVISLLTMGHSLGMLCGSVGAGLMMDWFDLGHAFSMGGVAMILGIVVFWICMRPGFIPIREKS